MGQPRASRREVVAASSDEEDDTQEHLSKDDQPLKPQKRGNGKLKPVSKAKKIQQPTPATSTQEGSSQKSPAKQKATKAKSKTALKDAPKPNGKPIYSFFNAATQRQQLSQPSASPEKLVSQDQTEAIHDESGDDGSSVNFSKGSSTVLTVRKRKVQHSTSFEDEALLPHAATRKFRKTSDGGRTPSISVFNEDKRTWTEQFAPTDLSELAVHKRKVADVRQWVETALNGRRQKILVLKGAAGTGKTATIALLAREMDLEVSEWHNPAGIDFAPESSMSTASQFEEFIGRAGRSGGLTFTSGDSTDVSQAPYEDCDEPDVAKRKRQLLLIEEFPNTFSRTSNTLQAFRSAIMQYVSSPPVSETSTTPIVMIISETLLSTNTAAADSFTAHRLLGPEIVNHPYVNMIEFNAVAPTILTKALESVVIKEARKSGRRKTPGPQVLKRLAETGDIRSAISSLEFLCLRGDDGEVWSSKVHFTKPKKKTEPAMTKAEEEALKLISNRQTSLGIFHAVGAVVYNKRVEAPSGQTIAQPSPWLPQHRRGKIVERDVDVLMNELGTDVSTFVAALHENYALSCACSSAEDTMDSLSGCADIISDADLLSTDRFSFGTRAFSGSAMDGLRQDEMLFHVAVRGLFFNLPSPVHRAAPPGGGKPDAFRMFYPTSLKLWKAKEEVEGTLEWLTSMAQRGKLLDSAAMSSRKPAVDGVEGWKRLNNTDTSRESPVPDSDVEVMPSIMTRDEMLVERLPYQAQILAPRHKSHGSSALLKQILSVSRVSGQATMTADDDPPVDDCPELSGPTELWTTDKPDSDLQPRTLQHKVRSTGKQKVETEGGGLSIPVETRVEKLVLEDDDIVDD